MSHQHLGEEQLSEEYFELLMEYFYSLAFLTIRNVLGYHLFPHFHKQFFMERLCFYHYSVRQ